MTEILLGAFYIGVALIPDSGSTAMIILDTALIVAGIGMIGIGIAYG